MLSVLAAAVPLVGAANPTTEATSLAASSDEQLTLPPTAYVSSFRVLDTHRHCGPEFASGACSAFTEGLAFGADGHLYESAGGYGAGSVRGVRRVDLSDGSSVGDTMEPQQGQFAEGLTVLPDGRALQLTYRENEVNEYTTTPSLSHVRTTSVNLGAEGWGLTSSADGSLLYATDSTDRLLHVNASTLEVVNSVPIFDARLDNGAGRPIWGVNELELVGGEVWGNVYPTCGDGAGGTRRLCDHSECVARIEPSTGRVLGWVDFTALLEREPHAVRAAPMDSVFNGIAYDAPSGRLLVTGKNWDSIYRVAVEPTSHGAEHVQSVCRLAS